MTTDSARNNNRYRAGISLSRLSERFYPKNNACIAVDEAALLPLKLAASEEFRHQWRRVGIDDVACSTGWADFRAASRAAFTGA